MGQSVGPPTKSELQELARHISQLIWSANPAGECDYLSPQWLEYTGVRDEAYLRASWFEFVHPDDRRQALDAWNASLSTGRLLDIEFRLRRHDGAYRWFQGRAAPIRDESGRITKWIGSDTDIDDLRRTKETLQHSESQLRDVMDTLAEGLVITDLQGKLIHWNRAASVMHGYEHRQQGNTDVTSYYSRFQFQTLEGQTLPLDQWPLVRILRGELLDEVEVRVHRTDQPGWSRVYSYGGSLVRDAEGRPTLACLTVVDRTGRHEAEQRIRESEQRFRALVEASSQIVWTAGPDGLGYEDSPTFRAFTGLTADELRDTRWFRVVHPDDRKRTMEQWQRAVERQEPYETEYRVMHVSGEWRWLHVRALPLRNPDGLVRSWVGMSSDITQAKQAQIVLEQAKEAAEAANRSKDYLLAVVSHELRTPLTPILASASHLQRHPHLPHSLRGDIEMICRNVETEARLVDDLLSLTRLTRGKIILHQETVDVHQMIQSLIEQFHEEITAKRLEIALELGSADGFAWADPTRLMQVLGNLMSNAVKFTPERGRVTIQTESLQQRIRIIFSDTGAGIEPHVMQRLFNPFEQGEQTVTRQFGGLGLGLSIARQLVELHGGTLTASSAGKDRGSQFVVELAAAPTDEKASAGPSAVSQAPTSGTVLLVEDHPDTQRALRRLMRSFGFHVETASSVSEALEKADGRRFDILLSDIGLPDGTGMQVMRDLSHRGEVKVGVALSGFGQPEDVQRSREAGFLEHLVKPVELERLRQVLENAIATVRRARD